MSLTGQKLLQNTLSIGRLIGRGDLGEVYHAEWQHQGQLREVAVKFYGSLQQNPSQSPHPLELIHQESLALSQISSPYIQEILWVDYRSDLAFVMSPYYPGGNLRDFLIQHPKASSLQAKDRVALSLQLGLQLSQALLLLHQKGIIHGDIKPSNICLQEENGSKFVLIDFGQSHFSERFQTNRSSSAVTLGYLAPERTGFLRNIPEGSSDLYSLGLCLYELLSGTNPFASTHDLSIVHKILYEIPPPLQASELECPASLIAIIEKLLRKNPRDRYDSAFDLVHDLQRSYQDFLENRPSNFALGSRDKLRGSQP